MTAFGLNSEYKKLKSVLLYKPGMALHQFHDPQLIQQNAKIDQPAISLEFDNTIKIFERAGIESILIDDHPEDENRDYLYNMMYCRDLFFMTPEGAIMANMSKTTRKGEVKYASKTLEKNDIPIIKTISADGSFEGADALWISENLVVVGVGHRTNHSAFEQIKAILKTMNVECYPLPSTQTITQHLLGSLQIVDSNMALVREHIINSDIITYLENEGYHVHKIPENSEVEHMQAMNIVTVAPRKICMTAGCQETKKIYEDLGLCVAAEMSIPQLIKGAGGLACAVGILSREK